MDPVNTCRWPKRSAMQLLKEVDRQAEFLKRTPSSVLAAIDSRSKNGNLRVLSSISAALTDFSSNDYLGFSTTGILKARIDAALQDSSIRKVGSTGSRLLTGNDGFERLEDRIAKFHGAEASLIFNSGYDANLGVLSALPTRHDAIFYDELSHASLRDGIRLSIAKLKISFKHNDIDDLRTKLRNSTGQRFVVVESLYSMDGDFAPLLGLCELVNECGAFLIVDEAHATGVFGDQGRGLVSAHGLEPAVFVRIFTFGKALGCHGAAVVGSIELKQYLVNFARSFIYTTALGHHAQVAIQEAYALLEETESAVNQLSDLIAQFRMLAPHLPAERVLLSHSPVQAIMFASNEQVRSAAAYLLAQGILAKSILHPTVPKGRERLRICLHSFNTSEEIRFLFAKLQEAL